MRLTSQTWLTALTAPVSLLASMAALAGDASRIVIDGSFNDWQAIAPALVDPADAPEAFVDLGEVRIAHDEHFVHVLIDFGRVVNAQGLDGTVLMLFDADGDSATGALERGLAGVEIIVQLTPPDEKNPDRRGMGIGLKSTTYAPDANDANAKMLTPYDVAMEFAPTYASRRHEFRFDRRRTLPNTPALFQGERFVLKLVCLDLNGAVVDESDPIVHKLDARKPAAGIAESETDPLHRAASADLRIVSWNLQHSGFLQNPGPFARILRALNPDVVLLQEISNTTKQEELRKFLNDASDPVGGKQKWNVQFGSAVGNLRCAIAFTGVGSGLGDFQSIAVANRPDQHVRVSAAEIGRHNGGNGLLALSIHLRCCGRAGSSEDLIRLEEVEALREAIAGRAPIHEGMIIAGDYNLVGSRDPLEQLALGLDMDGSALQIVEALQLDGRTAATWSDPKQPFVPGRLDYVLVSDSTMNVLRAFVLDTSDLSPRWLEHHQIEAGDTAAASDHFPIVVDVAWRGRQ